MRDNECFSRPGINGAASISRVHSQHITIGGAGGRSPVASGDRTAAGRGPWHRHQPPPGADRPGGAKRPVVCWPAGRSPRDIKVWIVVAEAAGSRRGGHDDDGGASSCHSGGDCDRRERAGHHSDTMIIIVPDCDGGEGAALSSPSGPPRLGPIGDNNNRRERATQRARPCYNTEQASRPASSNNNHRDDNNNNNNVASQSLKLALTQVQCRLGQGASVQSGPVQSGPAQCSEVHSASL